MNIRPNLHNVIVITVVAVLGILLLRMAGKTQLGNVPVVGNALRVASTA